MTKNIKTVKKFPIIIDNFFNDGLRYVISELQRNIFNSKEYQEFFDFFEKHLTYNICYNNLNINKNTQTYYVFYTVSISILCDSIKYNILNYPFYNEIFEYYLIRKMFFTLNKEMLSTYIFNYFKLNIIKKFEEDLIYVTQNYSGIFTEKEKLCKAKRIKSWIKFLKNDIIYNYDPENRKQELIICLDDKKDIKEKINITKTKIILNSNKNSLDCEDYDLKLKNSIIKSKNPKNKLENISIYITLKLTDNVYIELHEFYLDTCEELYNCKINIELFLETINNFINEKQLYSILECPNTNETKLISNISEITADNLLCSILKYNVKEIDENYNRTIIYILLN